MLHQRPGIHSSQLDEPFYFILFLSVFEFLSNTKWRVMWSDSESDLWFHNLRFPLIWPSWLVGAKLQSINQHSQHTNLDFTTLFTVYQCSFLYWLVTRWHPIAGCHKRERTTVCFDCFLLTLYFVCCCCCCCSCSSSSLFPLVFCCCYVSFIVSLVKLLVLHTFVLLFFLNWM